MLSSLAWVAALAGSPLVYAAPQFPNTPNLDGNISPIPSTTYSTVPTGTPVSSPYNSEALAALWSVVEETLPVESPPVSSVQAVNNSFNVPKTPTLPRSLQDHAS